MQKTALHLRKTVGGSIYTLQTQEIGGVSHYTLSVTEDGVSQTLDCFTDNAALAEAFFHLVTTHEVSPYHIEAVWEDMMS